MKARLRLCAAVVGVLLVGTLGGARADEERTPDATLKVSATAVAAGAGYSWGTGKLSYRGKDYDITLDGLTVGTVGVTSIEAVGEVYDLRKLEDFAGTYEAVVAGSTIGGGAGATTMKNQNGVVVKMSATTLGVGLTIGVSGVKLALKK
jgi:hypothetical protein